MHHFNWALGLASTCLIGCASQVRTPPCTGSVGVMLDVATATVGTNSIPVAVFEATRAGIKQDEPPNGDIRLQFFRTEGTELAGPGYAERRSLLPPISATPAPDGRIIVLPNLGTIRYNYRVEVSFGDSGPWGVEIWARVPWQQAPAIATIPFFVKAADSDPKSDEQQLQSFFLNRCERPPPQLAIAAQAWSSL